MKLKEAWVAHVGAHKKAKAKTAAGLRAAAVGQATWLRQTTEVEQAAKEATMVEGAQVEQAVELDSTHFPWY